MGLGKLLQSHQVAKVIASYVGENKEFERQYLAGEIEVEFCPQGTLAERCRVGGAGIPGFYTKTGVGTLVAEGKKTKEFDGQLYVLERHRRRSSDRERLEGRRERQPRLPKTARNFNQPATTSKNTVAEVGEIVSIGSLGADAIHVPGIYIKRLISGAPYDKKIEIRTTRAREVA